MERRGWEADAQIGSTSVQNMGDSNPLDKSSYLHPPRTAPTSTIKGIHSSLQLTACFPSKAAKFTHIYTVLSTVQTETPMVAPIPDSLPFSPLGIPTPGQLTLSARLHLHPHHHSPRTVMLSSSSSASPATRLLQGCSLCSVQNKLGKDTSGPITLPFITLQVYSFSQKLQTSQSACWPGSC